MRPRLTCPAWCFLLAPALAAGCLPVATGPYGTSVDEIGRPSAIATKAARLKISAREITGMSSRYFGQIELTLENPTSEWVRIQKVELDFGSEQNNQALYLPWGSELASWFEATRQRNAHRQANHEMVIGAIGVAGATLAVAGSGGSRARVAGGMASLAAATAAMGSAAQAGGQSGGDGPVFEGQHLFAVPIEVPPGLFLKRFIVVNTPAKPKLDCLTQLTLIYQLDDQSVHRVAVSFRASYNKNHLSDWQDDVCPSSYEDW